MKYTKTFLNQIMLCEDYWTLIREIKIKAEKMIDMYQESANKHTNSSKREALNLWDVMGGLVDIQPHFNVNHIDGSVEISVGFAGTSKPIQLGVFKDMGIDTSLGTALKLKMRNQFGLGKIDHHWI